MDELNDANLKDELKKGEWFPIKHKLFDSYAKPLGPTCLIIYLCIIRHRWKSTKKARISHEKIAQKIGVSRETVTRKISLLIKNSFLRVKKRRNQNGQWPYNEYEIIDSNLWLPPCDLKSQGYEPSPCDIYGQNRVINNHSKKNYKKNLINNDLKEERNRVSEEKRIKFYDS